MVTYEVSATVEPAMADAYERYMRERHIPDVFATGCFRRVAFERSAPGRYRVRYQAAAQDELDRYLREHTMRLRADFEAHFPSGVRLAREVWAELERWE